MNRHGYESLKARFRRAGLLDDVLGMLHWDHATLMPVGSAGVRAEQLAELKLLHHEIVAAKNMGDEIEDVRATFEAAETTDEWDQANLALMARAHVHAAAVPAELVAAVAKAAAACEMSWRRARADNKFADLVPTLETLLGLVREVAAAKGAALDLDPYDALLDQFEPGGRMARIEPVFDELTSFLPDFTRAVLDHQRTRPKPIIPEGPFPVVAQQAVGRLIMERIGFDFERGRLDTSAHPFCGGAQGDVRITTRYDEADFSSALLATIHETGHALYEFGRPAKHAYQPVGLAGGMALHESQSLTLEMQACRGPEFLGFVAPILADAFGDGPQWEPDNLYRLFTAVAPSFIRVDADEVTYPAHILMRTKLERAMIAGELTVADLPAAWNAGMEEYLGIAPPDDASGCLQDIHWPSGAFGYFPTYTMGAIAAAQLFGAARAAEPGIDEGLARGDFTSLIGWMAVNVHGLGSLTDTDGVLKRATGRPLDLAAYIGHLKARYLGQG
ncbi:MAG: carboxypeptidase M32 [Alphaproteobacteria bacterium]|nr:carboxypeptidase M32 [Alphaproteobacteria bacterium]